MHSHRLDPKFVSAIDNAPNSELSLGEKRVLQPEDSSEVSDSPHRLRKDHTLQVRYLDGAVNGNDVPIGIRSVLYLNGIDGMNDM